MGISHITLITVPVTDQDRAKEFYEKLGFGVINDHEMGPEEMPPEPGLRWIQLAAPGGGTTIVLATWQVGGLKPGAQHMSVACADAKAMHVELTEKGIDASPPFDAPWGAFFQISDPDGNGVMIVEESKS
ncbi:VOC family protein [Phytohabitans houttuyneae]|jgi:predicted enzyme related to lactoylglutathione lyase|uniref:Glyoxalase n=1 Tax=Phytohabitans houttuyneae TaxID=1076126 RepID=A0A6V8K8J0_9ACTN|nr:VOC family protein [Phytohabitans houttuyneae]GFJ81522.1 glyoxalase [Phytohabitans houttuyneae]